MEVGAPTDVKAGTTEGGATGIVPLSLTGKEEEGKIQNEIDGSMMEGGSGRGRMGRSRGWR